MRIFSKSNLDKMASKHNDAKEPVNEWYYKAKKADWNNFSEVKETFNSVDSVGNSRFVFNIKGNKYRLVVKMLFIPKMIYIKFFGKHADYDRIDCKNI